MEAGRRRVSADEVANLAHLYGVSINWLLGEEQEADSTSDRASLAARELGKLTEEDLDRLLELIQSPQDFAGCWGMIDKRSIARRAVAEALRFRQRAGINLHDPACVYDIAGQLGVEVRFIDIPSMEGMYL